MPSTNQDTERQTPSTLQLLVTHAERKNLPLAVWFCQVGSSWNICVFRGIKLGRSSASKPH